MKSLSYAVICGVLFTCLHSFAQDIEPIPPVSEEDQFSYQEGGPESEFVTPMTDEVPYPEIERQEESPFYPVEEDNDSWMMENEEYPEEGLVE